MSSDWIESAAEAIANRAEDELRAMVAISSPSGDVAGAEGCLSLAASLAPEGARAERVPCSSPGHADDMLLRLQGTGTTRVLLLGHVDTVVAHADHRPMENRDGRWVGSGTVDMKGGDVLALGVLRALEPFTRSYAEVALLLVCDEEWRQVPFAHAERFAGWDACLCFEAGERTPDGGHAVIVRRKAAGTVRVTGHGRASHAGAAPDKGRNALVGLAGAALHVAGLHDPDGPDHLTAVPTILRSGHALNVVPAGGELTCDLRADSLEAIEAAMASIPTEVAGAQLHTEALRLWPGMQATDATAPLLARASQVLGEPVVAHGRGGASDASHIATVVQCSVDGLGPRGGNAHHPDEFLSAESLRPRAAVALAVAAAALEIDP